MIQISTSHAISPSLSPELKELLQSRLSLMGGCGQILLVEPTDTPSEILRAAAVDADSGEPLGPYEWIQWHPAEEVHELVYITSDDGHAVVFFIPKACPITNLLKDQNSHEY